MTHHCFVCSKAFATRDGMERHLVSYHHYTRWEGSGTATWNPPAPAVAKSESPR